MSSFKEYWTGSKKGDKAAEKELKRKKALNGCTNTERDCGAGYVCLYGQCEKSTGNTGDQWCPTENNTSGCAGCGGNDYECSNGIVTIDFDGNKICVPNSCSNSSPCPSGYTCSKGTCQKSNCNSSKPCANGYFCVNGQCSSTPGDNGCSSNIDCPYGSTCGGGVCEPDSNVEQPNYGTDGQKCSIYCQSYFEENGRVDDGCRELTCGDCDGCSPSFFGSSTGSCSASNSCECKEKRGELPKCVKCGPDGNQVTDCGCSICSSVGAVTCPCGVSIPPQQYCKGLCEDGLVTGSSLNNQIANKCASACENGRDPSECDGVCYNFTTSSTNYSCPVNQVCKLVGQITVGANTEYIYKNCDPSQRPAYCEDTPVARRHIALSVIDEDDSYDEATKANDWRNYRAASPDGIFVVLVPNKGNGTVGSPPGFDGSRYTVSLTADWSSILQGPLANASSCYAFIDNSGSMTIGDVQGSLSQFSSYCAANGVAFGYTTNASENWIGPHVGR